MSYLPMAIMVVNRKFFCQLSRLTERNFQRRDYWVLMTGVFSVTAALGMSLFGCLTVWGGTAGEAKVWATFCTTGHRVGLREGT